MLTILTDAWHTLVPPAGDRDGPLSPLLLVLTVVTGLVDAFSYLVLGQVFVANMTGNVVFLGLAVAGAKGFTVAVHLLALGAFSVGAALSGRLVVRCRGSRGRIGLVAVSWAVGAGAGDPGSGPSRYTLVVLLAISGGLQTGTARRLAVPDLITTVLTRTIAGAAFDSRFGGGSDSKVGRRGLAVVALFAGAVVGAVLVLHVNKWLALVVALGLLVTVMVNAGRRTRLHPAWDRPE
jgi:uncharacterized membrane protein YoaK (UPF0700 family)